jgi:hypothetical protein
VAQRLDRQGTPQERQRFGKRLVAVLDYADPGSHDPGWGDRRWAELWQLGKSLMFDSEDTPITIIDGRLVERELDGLPPGTPFRMAAAKRRRVRDQTWRYQ